MSTNLNNDKLEQINKMLTRYQATFDTEKNMVEFEGNVYTIYVSIDYDKDNFFINICNPVKLKNSEIETFHQEIHFASKLTNKLNNILRIN